MESTQILQLFNKTSSLSRLVFIDPTVEDYQSLVAGVLPNTEVVILDAARDGVEQISEILTQRTGVTSLHLVSHGAPGRIYLGNTQLGQYTLNRYAEQLMHWADALSADAQILLYGCNVARTKLGKTFVQCLSELTGAVVLASDDRTGSAALGGNWELEVRTGTSSVALAFESATLEAYGEVFAKPYLIKDIFLGSSSSKISELINVNGTVYFVADDGIHGPELWKSDGTKQGTVLVKDIYLGTKNSRVSQLTQVNDTLYFAANDGTGTDYFGDKLWKTDGTETGTVVVKGVDYGFRTKVGSLVNFDGVLYFGFDDGNHRTSENTNDLWKTDGTKEGTVKVKDLGNQGFFVINSFLNVNDTLFFNFFSTDFYGSFDLPFDLWKSDGTQEGTIQLYNQDSILLTSINDTLYFFTVNNFDDIEGNIIGLELWKSDGTKEGTVLVKDINSGSSGSFPFNAIDFNGILYFSANDGTHGAELWKSDGTKEGTVLVKDINSGSGNSAPFNLTNVNNTLYFVANDGTYGAELWKSDGTKEGTVLVKDINSGSGDSAASSLINVNGTVYFVANDRIHGLELWKSDGTAEDTVLVADINPGSGSSDISDLNYFDGILYFLADDGMYGKELWALSINPAVTNPVISITAIDANAAEADNDPAVFRISRSGDTSTALIVKYNIDGTAINGKDYNQLNGTITIAAGQSFVDITITPADEILKEGSETVNLTLFNQSYYAVNQSQITATAVIADNVNTAAVPTQPYLVKDPESIDFNSSEMININGIFYFYKYDNIYGNELWKSDGTQAGTVLVKDINPGVSNSFNNNNGYPYFEPELINLKDTLYFFANNGTNGYELWKSDGTQAGTVLVKDINPGSFGSFPSQDFNYNFPSNLTVVNDILYFAANDGIHGAELWASDGTKEGTVLVKDLNPGSNDSFVKNDEYYLFFEPELINFKDTLYFFANDGTNGYELWKSDGTQAGTVLVKDINPGSFGSFAPQDFNYNIFPPNLTVVNDILYFAADDGTHGIELWASDGTKEGTVLVKDAIPGADSFYPSDLTNVDDILYFTADDRVNGRELWALNTNTSPFISTVSITATDANATEAGSSPSMLRISRTGDTNIALAVKYTISGTAINGSDYTQLTGIAGIAVGQSFVDINITPVDDDLVETSETIILTLTTGTDYDIDASKISASVMIADNDLNIINGGNSRDPLTGTDDSDRIVGGTGGKTITGGTGNDEFVYTDIREVGHRITDFTVDSDKIVLTQLLDSLVSGGYNGSDAFADGYVRVVQGSTTNSTILQIDRDGLTGSAVFRPFIQLDNVTPQAMNNINNFVF
ncbi:ELWxxDGT repeat protein [Halotia branconii]|uniref:DUF4347 domain-containing protein n=1 Tax=Halotia branconii CENA392 TaxID=1539056 RepID=A0AAJ6NYV3_9CYAN|nr:ELWxxDGT repeat protein [Halotia branconii]WGV29016.1 DUF4347 domain-containing protein [Halotia branconii CENA392]